MKLSFSSIERYCQCPRRYKLHQQGLRQKVVGSALLFGNAIDKALNALHGDLKEQYKKIYIAEMQHQIINGVDEILSHSENVSYSNSDFDINMLDEQDREYVLGTLKANGFELGNDLEDVHECLKQIKRERAFTEDERHIFNLMSWKSLMNKGLAILDAYVEQVLPRIKKVLGVQKYFEVYNDAGDSLLGYIDLICEWEDGRIIRFDHKASSQKYSKESIKDKNQLSTYTFGTEEEWPVKTVGYIVMPKKFRKNKLPKVPIDVIIDEISLEHEEEMIAIYDQVCFDIKQEEFDCTHNNCNSYKKDTGEFFDCPYKKYNESGSMENLIKVEKRKHE